jgi:transposase-like protein
LLDKDLYPHSAEIVSKRCAQFDECLSLPKGLRRIAHSSEPIEAIALKLRRRGAKLRTRFRGADDAIDRIAIMLKEASGGWKVYPHQWDQICLELPVLMRKSARV